MSQLLINSPSENAAVRLSIALLVLYEIRINKLFYAKRETQVTICPRLMEHRN